MPDRLFCGTFPRQGAAVGGRLKIRYLPLVTGIAADTCDPKCRVAISQIEKKQGGPNAFATKAHYRGGINSPRQFQTVFRAFQIPFGLQKTLSTVLISPAASGRTPPNLPEAQRENRGPSYSAYDRTLPQQSARPVALAGLVLLAGLLTTLAPFAVCLVADAIPFGHAARRFGRPHNLRSYSRVTSCLWVYLRHHSTSS